MELLLIRHAKAEDHGHPEGDYERALTMKGIRQSERVGEFLLKQNLVPELILTSPVRRAAETAEIISEIVDISEPITEEWLSCGMHPEEALSELMVYAEISRIALVGHEPDFSMLIREILGVEAGYVEVKKASVIKLTCRPPRRSGVLHFNIPPKFLK